MTKGCAEQQNCPWGSSGAGCWQPAAQHGEPALASAGFCRRMCTGDPTPVLADPARLCQALGLQTHLVTRWLVPGVIGFMAQLRISLQHCNSPSSQALWAENNVHHMLLKYFKEMSGFCNKCSICAITDVRTKTV